MILHHRTGRSSSQFITAAICHTPPLPPGQVERLGQVPWKLGVGVPVREDPSTASACRRSTALKGAGATNEHRHTDCGQDMKLPIPGQKSCNLTIYNIKTYIYIIIYV